MPGVLQKIAKILFLDLILLAFSINSKYLIKITFEKWVSGKFKRFKKNLNNELTKLDITKRNMKF